MGYRRTDICPPRKLTGQVLNQLLTQAGMSTLPVTISAVEPQEIKRQNGELEVEWQVDFRELKQPMRLNAITAHQLFSDLGEDTESARQRAAAARSSGLGRIRRPAATTVSAASTKAPVCRAATVPAFAAAIRAA